MASFLTYQQFLEPFQRLLKASEYFCCLHTRNFSRGHDLRISGFFSGPRSCDSPPLDFDACHAGLVEACCDCCGSCCLAISLWFFADPGGVAMWDVSPATRCLMLQRRTAFWKWLVIKRKAGLVVSQMCYLFVEFDIFQHVKRKWSHASFMPLSEMKVWCPGVNWNFGKVVCLWHDPRINALLKLTTEMFFSDNFLNSSILSNDGCRMISLCRQKKGAYV